MARHHYRGRFSVITVLLLLIIAGGGLLSACGKKGPLYMPGQEKTQQK